MAKVRSPPHPGVRQSTDRLKPVSSDNGLARGVLTPFIRGIAELRFSARMYFFFVVGERGRVRSHELVAVAASDHRGVVLPLVASGRSVELHRVWLPQALHP